MMHQAMHQAVQQAMPHAMHNRIANAMRLKQCNGRTYGLTNDLTHLLEKNSLKQRARKTPKI